MATNVPNLDVGSFGPFRAFFQWLVALVTGNRKVLPVAVLFTTNLAGTYANGTLGVGATLTKASAGAFPTTHGVVPFLGMRVLLTAQTTGAQSGYYTLSVIGSASVAWVLTRQADFDASADMVQGTLFAVVVNVPGPTGGAVQAAGDNAHQGEVWAFTGASSPVVGTDALTFAATVALQSAIGSVISGVTQFAQDALQVLNSAGTFYTKMRSGATANRTWTFPDADATGAQAGVASGSTTPGAGGSTAPAFTGTAPTTAENIASPAFSGTGQSSSGQVITTSDNQTMSVNQCAGMWFVSAAHGPYLIISNTAVTNQPAVLTIYGTPPTTDAGTYKIIAAPTPVGSVASHTHTGAAHTHTQT